jgi:glycosyltransferase involved in cell wall biosynthesis
MKDDSGLSIILTYYKGEQYIFKCIDSLLASYANSNRNLEKEIIIVIDSMDDSSHIIALLKEKYNEKDLVIILNERNLGVANSRNIGLKVSKYNFYTIIDQDDYVRLAYFSTLEDQLDRSSTMHIINGVFLFEEHQKELPIYYLHPDFSIESILLQTTTIYTPGTVVFNSDFVSKQDAFIETSDKYKGADDWAAYLNILLHVNKVKIKFISKCLFVYRLHGNNYSNNTAEMIFSALSVLEYFVKKYPKHTNIILKAQERYKFLYSLKVEKIGSIDLFKKFPSIFTFHYFTSLIKRDRINRMIFRLNKMQMGIN